MGVHTTCFLYTPSVCESVGNVHCLPDGVRSRMCEPEGVFAVQRFTYMCVCMCVCVKRQMT